MQSFARLTYTPGKITRQVEFLEARDAWLADSANRAGHGDLKQTLARGAPTSPYQVLYYICFPVFCSLNCTGRSSRPRQWLIP